MRTNTIRFTLVAALMLAPAAALAQSAQNSGAPPVGSTGISGVGNGGYPSGTGSATANPMDPTSSSTPVPGSTGSPNPSR
jgi:hypothetical protein